MYFFLKYDRIFSSTAFKGLKMKKIIYILIISAFMSAGFNIEAAAEPVSAPVKPPKTAQYQSAQVLNVPPLLIVNNPSQYLNKTVSFTGEFVSFTSLGLDYKPAFRDGSKYIGILMRRPDSQDYVIPLSELKMFMKRELAEKNINIEQGDTFKLKGKVFSNALGDPWLDITEFKIIGKKNKQEEK